MALISVGYCLKYFKSDEKLIIKVYQIFFLIEITIIIVHLLGVIETCTKMSRLRSQCQMALSWLSESIYTSTISTNLYRLNQLLRLNLVVTKILKNN